MKTMPWAWRGAVRACYNRHGMTATPAGIRVARALIVYRGMQPVEAAMVTISVRVALRGFARAASRSAEAMNAMANVLRRLFQEAALLGNAMCENDDPLDDYYRRGDEQYDFLSLDERDERYGGL